jgi:hypothetical protein
MTELPYSPYLVSEYVSATERITQTMYTADQMRNYGRAEYLRGLEDAAKVCDAHTVDDVLVGVGIGKSCAAMIRALKEQI